MIKSNDRAQVSLGVMLYSCFRVKAVSRPTISQLLAVRQYSCFREFALTLLRRTSTSLYTLALKKNSLDVSVFGSSLCRYKQPQL